MTDMLATIAPKSDQLNADDLIGGPRTIRITKVSASGSPDQPINVSFEGDNGKPYKPCKSMRRLMVALWGPDAANYVGRSMTLYCDPKVKFGGIAVGGIRISHMTDIDADMTIALTESKAKRTPFTVRRLTIEEKAPAKERGTMSKSLDAIKGSSAAMLDATVAGFKDFAWTRKEYEQLDAAVAERRAELRGDG